MRLKDKHIILGITGSIAAYKAAYLTRLLIKEGAEVKIIMTPYGKEFITPVTLATLSKNTVLCDFFRHDDGAWNSHVELGIWADLMLIAPASANSMAKMANGICDNLLLTSYLSVRCPVMLAPAMDFDMFRHPATRKNLEVLKSYGNIIIEPASGELASGLTGKGRMEEPELIVEEVVRFFDSKKKLSGKKFLVTSGPTFEAIDPVRYIGNHSSGKMGYAMALRLAEAGAEVTFISGPVAKLPEHHDITVEKVTTADEMYQRATALFPKMTGAVLAAAVADYRPEKKLTKKWKRGEDKAMIALVQNPDIAASLGKLKKKKQVLIGFALETENGVKNAKEKLIKKNLDLIILNSLSDTGSGFGTETNKITIIDRNNKIEEFKLKQKSEVALDIVNRICEWLAD